MIRMMLQGWQWAIQWLASKVFWEWECIPLFGLEPYVLGLSMGRMPHRVKEDDDEPDTAFAAFERLRKAMVGFFVAVTEVLYIPQLVEWAAKEWDSWLPEEDDD